jgi:hypothetical protein
MGVEAPILHQHREVTTVEELPEIQGHQVADGDYIKVRSIPGAVGFYGKVRGIWITEDGEITGVDVWGGRPGYEKMRTFRPERLQVLSTRMQNKMRRADDERKEA